jgi:hypothetical protein
LRPPPGRRTRSASSRAAVASSFKPRPIVLTAMPVARDTAAIPPYPAARASVAANSRRPRSSRCGKSKAKRAQMPAGSIIPTRYGIAPPPRIPASAPRPRFTYSLTDPNGRPPRLGRVAHRRQGAEGRVHLQLPPTLCRDSGYAGACVEAVAAPEATKAEGNPKRAVPQGQKRQDQQAAS